MFTYHLSGSVFTYNLSFIICHLLEYACPFWNSYLSSDLSDKIGSVQKRSLRIIYKECKIPLSFLLKSVRITTWKERRDKICLRFAKSAISNPRTEDIFPNFHDPFPRVLTQPPWQSQRILWSMSLLRGSGKVLSPLFWSTLIIPNMRPEYPPSLILVDDVWS